jgi:hypothetical protein
MKTKIPHGQKHATQVTWLIEQVPHVSYGRSAQSVENARRFEADAKHVFRVFGMESALQGMATGVVKLLTEEEAEVERMLDQFTITDAFDREHDYEPIDRRCCIDREVLRFAEEWLKALLDRLPLDRQRRPKARSRELAVIHDRVRNLREGGLSFLEICQRLDESGQKVPASCDWRGPSWSQAYRTHTRAVTSWLSKAIHRTQ